MAKRALCVGVSYDEAFVDHPAYTLGSTFQDVDNFSRLLIGKYSMFLLLFICIYPSYAWTRRVDSFGYEPEEVTVLKDDGESIPPTKYNIVSDAITSILRHTY